jgi:peptidyl-prolyl cis-trans isomerase SurA
MMFTRRQEMKMILNYTKKNRMIRKIVLLMILGIVASMNSFAQPKPIDKIVAVLGESIILTSDIDGQYSQYLAQGYKDDGALKCQIIEALLTQKMLQNQAMIDSLEISEQQVEDELNRRIKYFISQIGSAEKLEQFIGKSILEFKAELREDVRAVIMAQNMQQEITRTVNVTPNEIKKFYETIPKDSLPFFNKEVQVGIITKKPIVSAKAKQEAKDKLESLRERVAKGEDFSTLAILYSQDGSAKSGGELGFVGRGELVKAFEQVAFKLRPGELSSVVETEFGFHIVQLIERRGEQVNVRHILIKPTFDYDDLLNAKKVLDSVYNLILTKEITFAEAAEKFSDDDATKNNAGLMLNPQDGSTKIPSDQVDPSIYFQLENMKETEIAPPSQYKTATGETAYRIINFVSKTEPHQANLKDDYQKIQQAALQSKQNKVMEEWFSKRRKQTYVKINEEFATCEKLQPWIKETVNRSK